MHNSVRFPLDQHCTVLARSDEQQDQGWVHEILATSMYYICTSIPLDLIKRLAELLGGAHRPTVCGTLMVRVKGHGIETPGESASLLMMDTDAGSLVCWLIFACPEL